MSTQAPARLKRNLAAELPGFFDDCHHQFLLSDSEPEAIPGFSHYCLGRFHLFTHPSLPVLELRSNQQTVGWLLGHAIDPRGAILKHPPTISIRQAAAGAQRVAEAVEAWIDQHGGRFCLIVLSADVRRLYMDATGSLAAVYDAKLRWAASTPTILHAAACANVVHAADAFLTDKPNQFYPAGLTAVPAINRLLPNHYLDLDDWRAVRHWPREPIESATAGDTVSCAIDEISDILCANVRGVVMGTGHAYLALTGGLDSRVVAAVLKRHKLDSAVTCVTFDYRTPGRDNALDLYLSRLVAGRVGLRHKIIPVETTVSSSITEQYQLRTGFCGGAGKARDFFDACARHLNTEFGWLTGFAGEIGRAYYWKRDSRPPRIDPEGLLQRLGLPVTEVFRAAVDRWLRDVPAGDSFALLDLAYLELRVGCWASPHLYGGAGFPLNVTPFSHRRLIDRMLRLPVESRRRGLVATGVISANCSSLSSLPFNDWPSLWWRRGERMVWRLQRLKRFVN